MSSAEEPMSRSQALNTVFASGAAAAAVVAGLPSVALADGAKSLSTKARARGYYGRRIEALQGAVEKGDTAAILDEQNIFGLFNSGVYSTDKKKFAVADELAKSVVSAAREGNHAELKKAYTEYTKYTEKKSGYKSAEGGRGWGSEFDYKSRYVIGGALVVCIACFRCFDWWSSYSVSFVSSDLVGGALLVCRLFHVFRLTEL